MYLNLGSPARHILSFSLANVSPKQTDERRGNTSHRTGEVEINITYSMYLARCTMTAVKYLINLT